MVLINQIWNNTVHIVQYIGLYKVGPSTAQFRPKEHRANFYFQISNQRQSLMHSAEMAMMAIVNPIANVMKQPPNDRTVRRTSFFRCLLFVELLLFKSVQNAFSSALYSMYLASICSITGRNCMMALLNLVTRRSPRGVFANEKPMRSAPVKSCFLKCRGH